MIIVDENVDQVLIEQLLSENYEILLMREFSPGLSDKGIIKLAREKNGVILTEDKDFGELVFSHDIEGCSVIFLWYKKTDYMQIGKNILKVLENYDYSSVHFFFTITRNRIRIKRL